MTDALGLAYSIVAVGDGPLARDLKTAIFERKNLTWVRQMDSIETVLAASDVLIVPSRIEGIPLVVLEALALGTPVVATAVGGLPELVDSPGVTLVEKDDLEGFVRAIRSSVKDPDLVGVELEPRLRVEETLRSYDKLIDGHDKTFDG